MEGKVAKRRPDEVTIIAIYHFVEAALSLVGLAFIAFAGFVVAFEEIGSPDVIIPVAALGLVGFVLLLIAVANVAVGWGLLRLQTWARWGAVVLSVFRLGGFPVGTLIGGATIYFLVREEAGPAFEAE